MSIKIYKSNCSAFDRAMFCGDPVRDAVGSAGHDHDRRVREGLRLRRGPRRHLEGRECLLLILHLFAYTCILEHKTDIEISNSHVYV